MGLNPIDNPNEDTEFNDILRKHGILPERQVTPPPASPPPAPSLSETLVDKTADELAELEEDAIDSDEERIVAEYRRKRMAQMQKNQKEWKFGEIMPIGRDDYSREVTEASKVDEPGGSGTGVVVFLYKDGDPPCVQLRSQLELMARRYPRTKFVSIVGNKCIENYPDRLQPTLILYRAGEVAAQVVSWGKDRAREPQELEALLVVSKVVSMEHRINDVDSRPKRNDEELSEEELLSSLNIRSSNQSTKDSRIRKNVTVEDDDSDFDL